MPEAHSPALVGTRLVALSAERWSAHRATAERVVGDALAAGTARFLMLDAAALARVRPSDEAPRAVVRTVHVALTEWLRVTAQHYTADEQRIAADLIGAAGAELWIDGTAFNTDALADVLMHMRRVLFGAVRWPTAMVFILREDVLPGALDLLPTAFYLLPTIKSHREGSAYALKVYQTARYARLFGLSRRSVRAVFARERVTTFWRKLAGIDKIDF